MPSHTIFIGRRLQLQQQHDALILTLDNRDSINKFDQRMLEELEQALGLAAQQNASALILFSPQKVFFAGGDIEEFVERFTLTEAEIDSQLARFQDALMLLERLPPPTACLITGAALGGGIELALACDTILAHPKARLALPEVELGIMPGTGGSVRLHRRIGLEKTLQWVGLGEYYRGHEALAQGLVDELIPEQLILRDQLIDFALQRAISAAPKITAVKQSNNQQLLQDIQQQIRLRFDTDLSLKARLKAVETLCLGYQLAECDAYKLEREVVCELGRSAESRQLVQKFLIGQK